MSTGASTVTALLAVLLRELSETGKAEVGGRSFLIGAGVSPAGAQSITLTVLGVRYCITVTDERDS